MEGVIDGTSIDFRAQRFGPGVAQQGYPLRLINRSLDQRHCAERRCQIWLRNGRRAYRASVYEQCRESHARISTQTFCDSKHDCLRNIVWTPMEEYVFNERNRTRDRKKT